MRRIFVAAGKIIGLLQVFWALTYLASIGLVLGQMARTEPGMARAITIQLGGIVGYAVLAFGMAWLLLVRTEWLADKLKIPADDPLPSLSDDVVLHAGIKVVGVYIIATGVPALARAVADAAVSSAWQSHLTVSLSRIVPAVLKVVLAVLLTIRTEFVLRVISKGEKTHGRKILVGGFVLLILVVLLTRGLAMHPWLRYRKMVSRASAGTSVTDKHAVIREPATNVPAASDEWFGESDWTDPAEPDGDAVATEVVVVEVDGF